VGQAIRVTFSGGTEPHWWAPSFRNDIGLFYRNGDRMWAVELVPTATTLRIGTRDPLFQGNFISSIYRSEYSIHPTTEQFLMVMEEPLEEVSLINVLHNWERMNR
jgi:hypothetical protein